MKTTLALWLLAGSLFAQGRAFTLHDPAFMSALKPVAAGSTNTLRSFTEVGTPTNWWTARSLSSGLVSSWKSIAGASNTLTCTSSTKQPSYQTTALGGAAPAVCFTNTWLTNWDATMPTIARPYTVVMHGWLGNLASKVVWSGHPSVNPMDMEGNASCSYQFYGPSAAAVGVLSNYCTIAIVSNFGASAIYTNGVLASAANPGSSSFQGIALGTYSPSMDFGQTWCLADFVVYPTNLDATAATNLDAICRNRAGY